MCDEILICQISTLFVFVLCLPCYPCLHCRWTTQWYKNIYKQEREKKFPSLQLFLWLFSYFSGCYYFTPYTDPHRRSWPVTQSFLPNVNSQKSICEGGFMYSTCSKSNFTSEQMLHLTPLMTAPIHVDWMQLFQHKIQDFNSYNYHSPFDETHSLIQRPQTLPFFPMHLWHTLFISGVCFVTPHYLVGEKKVKIMTP